LFENKVKIENIIIKEYANERRLNGNMLVIGNCRVISDDFGEEPFTMNFSYTGKSNEPSSKLLESLQVSGWKEYRDRKNKETKTETLMDFVKNNN